MHPPVRLSNGSRHFAGWGLQLLYNSPSTNKSYLSLPGNIWAVSYKMQSHGEASYSWCSDVNGVKTYQCQVSARMCSDPVVSWPAVSLVQFGLE